MPLASRLPYENGLSCHAWRQLSFVCVLTLVFCIASAYAALAPLRQWPLGEQIMPLGLSASYELSHDQTYTVLTQAIPTSSNTTNGLTSRSYHTCSHRKDDIQRWLESSEDSLSMRSSMARKPPNWKWKKPPICCLLATSSFLSASKAKLLVQPVDQDKFMTPIFEDLPRLDEEQEVTAARLA